MGAVDEVVGFASDLIRIDTTNTGDEATTVGERAAAEYVAGKLAEVGYDATYLESGARGRGNVVARLAGGDPGRGALLVHAHLDVVPADAADWSVHPLSGEVADGYLWGRGAIDMKHMVAMSLAVARQLKREGHVPPRDLIFAFVADEESGGFRGARWLAEHRPDLFEGATEAIGEVGGFSVTLREGVRAYLVQTAEKAALWLRLRTRGQGGHGSLPHADSALATLADAVTRLHRHSFPVVWTDPVRELVTALGRLTGHPIPADDPEPAIAALGEAPGLGGLSRLLAAALRDTAAVTIFNAGLKANVIPGSATAEADCRVLPGREEAFVRELAAVLGPGIEWEYDSLPAIETTFDGSLVERMRAAIGAEDPGAPLLPYLLPAATDAKSFQSLGIRHFGFAPVRLPAELDFPALFHGVDERVPIDGLRFGTRVLERLLRDC
ncbi:M20/M25/M40 family metallo-hydrolase [Rugosimonospora acidiphila]|uniref:M20/M25/M40 family metallo-hydrolase n=1 Tax=Rugosimonospora acidiphila TaxID=556531 RepID=A0ABP9SR76_9ACTN